MNKIEGMKKIRDAYLKAQKEGTIKRSKCVNGVLVEIKD